ncbi:MAG: DUF4432 family protein, partial [Chloroflexi bacterium]|nr:DUF4432 family protein [Chloroflexota bacterium]
VHKPTDTDFLWRSNWGVRDPRKFIAPSGDGVGSWMDTYEGGWQTVLPGGGFPSRYGGADMGLHAEVNNVPWDAVIVEDTPERVSLRCSVRTFRTPFFFEKTLTLTAGSPVLELEQTLVNEGEEPVHCVWGEHIAIGGPFLSEDCVIDLPGGHVINDPNDFHPNNRIKAGWEGPWPMTELKDGTPHDLSKIPSKDFRSYDQSYITDMPEGWYAITNRRLGLGFGVVFPTDVYKYLWYWQSFGGGYGYPWYGRAYNIGLEPFTSYTNEGLSNAVDNGTALLVQPGQRVETSLKALAFEGTGVERINADGTVVTR